MQIPYDVAEKGPALRTETTVGPRLTGGAKNGRVGGMLDWHLTTSIEGKSLKLAQAMPPFRLQCSQGSPKTRLHQGSPNTHQLKQQGYLHKAYHPTCHGWECIPRLASCNSGVGYHLKRHIGKAVIRTDSRQALTWTLQEDVQRVHLQDLCSGTRWWTASLATGATLLIAGAITGPINNKDSFVLQPLCFHWMMLLCWILLFQGDVSQTA